MKIKNKKINILSKTIIFSVFAFLFLFLFSSNTLAAYVEAGASPNPVLSGWSTTVAWQAGGVDYCSTPDGTGSLSGQFVTPPLYEDTYYKISCVQQNACVPRPASNYWLYDSNGVSLGPSVPYCYGLTSLGGSNCVTAQASYSSAGYPMQYVCMMGNYTVQDEVWISVEPNEQSITNALTGNVTNVEDTNVNLNGSFNPGGDTNAVGYFRYSYVSPESITPVFCNDIYGSNMKSTREINLGGSSGSTTFSTKVTGLQPNTQYFYCAVGSNADGIIYGGVKSFVTKFPSPVITTKPAAPVSGTAVYLNASFNAPVKSTTYFEYRKKSLRYQEQEDLFGNPVSIKSTNIINRIKNSIEELLGSKKVLAANAENSWIRVGTKTRNAGASGTFNFLLKNLTPSTSYEYRAVIETEENVVTKISYGEILPFNTNSLNTTNPGEVPGGEGQEDPCTDPEDINCNGTGGNGTGNSKKIGPGLPDLTAGTVSPVSVLVNNPTALTAYIKNQGNASTGKDFFAFFQISTVSPDLITGESQTGKPAGTAMNNFKKLFTTEKVRAATMTGSENYSAGQSTNGGVAAYTKSTGTTIISGTLTNFPAVVVPALGAKMSKIITSNGKFTSAGIYYARACADKSSISDSGLIKESYENNNCGPWSTISVGNICADKQANNYGAPLPCRYDTRICLDTNAINYGSPLPCKYIIDNGNSCADPAAKNYGSPLPCIYETGICVDSKAINYGSALPCRYTITDTDSCKDSTANNYGSPLPCIYNNTRVCLDSSAINYGFALPCIYVATKCSDSSAINYGSAGICRYENQDYGDQDYENQNGNGGELSLGQIATPPVDAIVRYHEGIEHVFARQIMKNNAILQAYGYQTGTSLESFAWNLADLLAISFGYIGEGGKEIRVSLPDIAAYELRMNGSVLTVYEYFDSKIVNIQSTTANLRSIYEYEYYFVKR